MLDAGVATISKAYSDAVISHSRQIIPVGPMRLTKSLDEDSHNIWTEKAGIYILLDECCISTAGCRLQG